MKQEKPEFSQLPQNVKYGVNYEAQSSGCITSEGHDGDYCRCSVITNAHVPVDVNNAYSLACMSARSQGLHSDLRFYCLERVISCALRESPNCFEVNVCGGYYGEEVDGVTIASNTLSKINNFISDLNKKPTKVHRRKLVEATLRAEYGYILPALEGKEWEISKVPLVSIKPGHDSYRSVNTGSVAQYAGQYSRRDGDILSCLCKKINDQTYVLVDGYHRYAAASQRGDKNMLVVWCQTYVDSD